jgi:hypothetical protein
MHRPLFLLSKLFLGSLAAIAQLPSGYSLEPSNYNDIQVSSFASEKNNDTNQYEYAIGGQNTGDQYMLLSQTRMTINDAEYAPINNDSPFFCREVVKPNDAFNLEYETSGNYEQSQIEMTSISYGPVNESVIFIRNIPKEAYSPFEISHDLFRYFFEFEFNEIKMFSNDKRIIYYLIVKLDFNENSYDIICDASVGNDKVLIVDIVTNYQIDSANIEIKDVKVIEYYIEEHSLLSDSGKILVAIGWICLGLGSFLFSIGLIVAIVLTAIQKKKRSN